MFLLSPNRGAPPRFRETDSSEQRSYILYYHNSPSSPPVECAPASYNTGSRSWIADDTGPGWHDVVHEKHVIQDSPVFSTFASGAYCPHVDYYTVKSGVPAGNAGGLDGGWAAGYYTSYQDILSRPEVQNAMEAVLREWEIKLYSFRPDNLPDMAVFFKELQDVSSIFSVLWDLAQSLIGLAKRRYKIVAALDREVKVLRRMETVTNRRNIERQRRKIKSYRTALRELASLRLGYNFGVQTAIRDLTQIVAAFYDYMQTMTYEPTHEHIRRTVSFVDVVHTPLNEGCWGQLCYEGYADTETLRRTVDVTISCNVVFKNTLRGSPAERAVYTVLSQLGLMPDLTSIWDMTKFSWLFDYFVRTQQFISRIGPGLGLGLQAPLVYNSDISLKIVQTLEGRSTSPCVRLRASQPLQSEYHSHYERLVNTDARSLASTISLFRSPSLGQATNATALLLQSLL